MSLIFSALALGLAAVTPVLGQGAGSPAYNYMYQYPLPIPSIAQPIFSIQQNGTYVDYYTITIEDFTQQVYPNLGPAHLTGYNGTAPGPTFMIEKGREAIVRYVNNGHETASVHLHGSYTHSVWDGWASDELEVGEWKDYYYPNSESARSMWYHDHALGHTAADAYYGQAGAWIIYDPAENSLGLPTGKYDVPLALTDKIYQSNGDLASPTGNTFNFFGDVIEVNNQPWPYMSVEPRKYRLRFFDMALSRVFTLSFADKNNNQVPFQVIASDSGLFGAPVSSNTVTVSPGERYEVVIDFSQYSGQNITLNNGYQTSIIPGFDNTGKVMRFVVGKSVSDSSNNNVPSVLNPNVPFPVVPKGKTVDHTFNFQLGGESQWTINGVDFNDVNNRVLARPTQGTVQLWSLHHSGGPAVHPVHVHLVNMQVVSRSGGTRGLQKYEIAGLKDVVLLEPGETVQVLAMYGPWNGMYMFHCHNLIHEDNTMLDAFNVTLLENLGYEYPNSTTYGNPEDARFAPKQSVAADFQPAAVTAAVQSLAQMRPYASASEIMDAENAFWATATIAGETQGGASTTAAAQSTGAYFPSTGITTAVNPAFAQATKNIGDYVNGIINGNALSGTYHLRRDVWETVVTPAPTA
ncbi:hypothetical protein AMS68_002622 [Peltaster fructicola]|uniref:Plastocyanin-like domain-containing protein n=1 Tax=Peltaster fructicola TaxID=286661 RepID=A0A6H0XR42_9PEZI|nr:hypothetical protein AMS68_002622 [Peltaster fructicola]